MANIAIGIDLGTTFSVAAHLDNQGRPWTITNAEGDLTTPSVVYFDGQRPIVGKEALKAATFDPERVVQYIKRSMGDRVYERPIGGHQLPPEIIQALILKKVKQDTELKLGSIHEAVITVPAYFNEPRRKATQDAGRLAGLEVLDIINEPTAAAVAFGVQQGFLDPHGESAKKETILVYDLGGGTFDATLMEMDGQHYRTLATAGDVYLGGIDWDMRIVNFVARHFEEEYGADPRQDARAHQVLISEASDAKHALSAREKVVIQFAWEGNRIRLPLARAQFESLTEDLLDRTLLTIRRILREANVKWAELTRLLLVGGSTRMPMIPRMLEEESGLIADRSLAPDEAVAHGAAIYAGLLAGNPCLAERGMSVANVNSHDLGVLGIEPESGRHRREVIIPRNTPLPANRTASFATRRDGQPNVLVAVIEGGDRTGTHATHIGRCVVRNLPPDLPARTPVDVNFHYAADGRLTVTASLPGTPCNATTEIERFSGLPEEALADWIKRIDSGAVLPEQAADPINPASTPNKITTEESIDRQPFQATDSDTGAIPANHDHPQQRSSSPSSLFASDTTVDFEALAQLETNIQDSTNKTVDRDDTALNDFLNGLK